jgi:hypothetical protein
LFRGAAAHSADRRAAAQIMQHFDFFENALFLGSDEPLAAFRDARMANADWGKRFFNDEDDAGRRLITGEVTPQEVANYIVGGGRGERRLVAPAKADYPDSKDFELTQQGGL